MCFQLVRMNIENLSALSYASPHISTLCETTRYHNVGVMFTKIDVNFNTNIFDQITDRKCWRTLCYVLSDDDDKAECQVIDNLILCFSWYQLSHEAGLRVM